MGYFHFPMESMSPTPAPPVSVPPGCELASLLQRKSWFQDLGRDSCATSAVFKRPQPPTVGTLDTGSWTDRQLDQLPDMLV